MEELVGAFNQKKRKKKQKKKKTKTTALSSNWPMWRLETTRGSKRYEDNRGFIKMFSSLPEERAVRTEREGEGEGKSSGPNKFN